MIVDLEHAQHYRWGDGCDGWHLLASPTLSVIRERMPPGTAEIRHRHERAQQFFQVLAGTLTIALDGAMHTLAPEQGLHVPAGIAHQVLNRSADDVHFLVISEPPSHGDREPAPLPEVWSA
ncbi:MAG TPA: cupin domain-containing protein [Chitinolyticbacter sp.]|nr:cupin domain-containing protein [Chitinolyticbacter sp.]